MAIGADITNRLILAHAAKAIEVVGIFWFRPDDAIKLISEARAMGVPLLGFDAAAVRPGESTQPSLEKSWDYSRSTNSIADTYGHAIQFIEDRSASGYYFEIVLGTISN
jgi:hypothetical protein